MEGAVRPLLILSFMHSDYPKYSASRQRTLLSFQINVTMTRKVKTTGKHSQLNEFRVGFAQQSGSEVDNKSCQKIGSEGPLTGSNFSLGDT